MKKIFIIGLMMFSLIISGCERIPTIYTPAKSIKRVKNYIIAEGRWKKIQDTTSMPDYPKNNAVKIYCDKETMTYREDIASLWMPKEHKLVPKGYLYVNSFEFPITEWTPDDTITIVFHAPVKDVEIKISLKDEFAEIRTRETKARGNDTADSSIYSQYILE